MEKGTMISLTLAKKARKKVADELRAEQASHQATKNDLDAELAKSAAYEQALLLNAREKGAVLLEKQTIEAKLEATAKTAAVPPNGFYCETRLETVPDTHGDNISCFDAQTEAVVMSEIETEVFMDEGVTVYKQIHTGAVSKNGAGAGVAFEVENTRSFTRIQFLRFYAVWFVVTVMHIAIGGINSTTVFYPDNNQVMAAVNNLATLTPQQFNDFHYGYMFPDDGSGLPGVFGYYAKDKTASGILKSTFINSPVDKPFYSSTFKNIFTANILDKIDGHVDGMSWLLSWVYSGGHGLAGWHHENGFLPFLHHMPKISFSFPDDGGDGTVHAQLVQVLQSLAMKNWVFYTASQQSLAHDVVLGLNNDIAGSFGMTGVADEILVSRQFFFNPLYLQNVQHFTVVHQMPGQTVVSGTHPAFGYGFPHQVSGFGLVSFACNLAFSFSLQVCIMAEAGIAAIIRKASGEYKKARLKICGQYEAINSFLLSAGCMFRWLKGGVSVDTSLFRAVQYLYGVEPQLSYTTSAGSILHIPFTSNGAQCEKCGGVCVGVMYVLERQTDAHLCGYCAALEGPRTAAKFCGVTFVSQAHAKISGLSD